MPEFDESLLEFLRCPVSRSALTLAGAADVEELNQRIRSGGVNSFQGEVIERALDAGLVNADRSLVFPIREGILILVVDQAISMSESAQDS